MVRGEHLGKKSKCNINFRDTKELDKCGIKLGLF